MSVSAERNRILKQLEASNDPRDRRLANMTSGGSVFLRRQALAEARRRQGR